MTTISPDATARRESARVNGRFGEQEHTAPESNLITLDRASTAHDLWKARQEAARELEAATINQVAAHLPEHVKGLRLAHTERGIRVAEIIPQSPGGHVTPADVPEVHRDIIEAYAGQRSMFVELELANDLRGMESWNWVPSAESRAIPGMFADTAREDAKQRFRAAQGNFSAAAAEYLRNEMPEGAVTVEVAFAPAHDRNVSGGVPVVIAMYDAEGEFVSIDPHGPEFADYRTILANTPVADMFAVEYGETGGATYTINRDEGHA